MSATVTWNINRLRQPVFVLYDIEGKKLTTTKLWRWFIFLYHVSIPFEGFTVQQSIMRRWRGTTRLKHFTKETHSCSNIAVFRLRRFSSIKSWDWKLRFVPWMRQNLLVKRSGDHTTISVLIINASLQNKNFKTICGIIS